MRLKGARETDHVSAGRTELYLTPLVIERMKFRYYDFHGEAHDGKPDEFTSFETATSDQSESSLPAPFTGRASWYWQNDGVDPVVIPMHTRGQYEIIEQH